MFKTQFSLFLLAATSLAFGRHAARAQDAASVPRVDLSYAETFDEVCAEQTHYTTKPAWIVEVNRRLPEFRANWDRDGRQLLVTTAQVVGIPWRAREFAVALSVCSFPSMAEPLLVNVRYSLASFTTEHVANDVTTSIIYHEILHHYLADKVPSTSPLLRQYKDENPMVLEHVHLFALQEAVYRQLQWTDTLTRVIAKDESLPNPAYKRAWALVNTADNAARLLGDLRR